MLLYIQIKASSKLPRIKSSDIIKLKSKSDLDGALPVVATLQPFFQLSNQNEGKIITTTTATTTTTISTCTRSAIKKSIKEKKEKEKKIEFKIYFYNLSDWSKLDL